MIHELIALLVRAGAWLAWQVADHIYLTIVLLYVLGAAFWLTCLAMR
jgi:hypothetical protein